MKLSSAFSLGAALLTASAPAFADELAPAAARAQLEQGYELRKLGRCNEAIPHLAESIRLDRQPRALLNLADCEEKLGKLVAAQQHFVQARDLANAQGLTNLGKMADQRLTGIEKKMPKLVIRLAPGAPADTTVLRDGVELGAVSLNVPLPINPGHHMIVARSSGAEQEYEIDIAEGQNQKIDVTVQRPPTSSHDTPAATLSPSSTASADYPTPQTASRPAVPVPALVLGGIGVAALAVGTLEGFHSLSQNRQADAACAPASCTSEQYLAFHSRREDAIHARTLSIVAFSVGGAAIAGAAITLLAKPHAKNGSSDGFSAAPLLMERGAGLLLHRNW